MRNYVMVGLLGLFCLWSGWFLAKMSPKLVDAWYEIRGIERSTSDLTWSHAFNVYPRRVDEPKVTDQTARFGVEVYRDEVNGNLVYVTNTGSIAVVPD